MLISKAYGILYNKIKKIVVLSTDGQEEVLIYNKWLNLDIYKLYNPISFTEKKVDIEKIKYLKEKYGSFFLVVSRMSPQKDPYTIIDSMEILSKKYDINNNVLFLGNGPEMSKVKEYARKTSISHLINFLGNVSDVENYYSSAQLFIHSSPLEGLPTVLLESLYFEVPIVATDSKPGVREILGNNEYGRICPVGDSKAMAREISSLLSDEKIYNKYKSLSKDRADDFSEIKITKELLYIIKNSSL
nr:glycosyltransferase [Enterococcus lemanii]